LTKLLKDWFLTVIILPKSNLTLLYFYLLLQLDESQDIHYWIVW